MDDICLRLPAEIPHLRRYARTLVASLDEADDLVQECLERALSRASQWNPNKGTRPWLFSIMHNNFVSSIRKRKRQNELQHRYPVEDRIYGNYELHYELDRVHHAVNKLPPDQRDVIILVAVTGLSYEEISEALSIPIGTVRSRLSRAREGLRSLLSATPVDVESDKDYHDGHRRSA